MTGGGERAERLLDRRRRLLGPAYRHFYSEPVEIVRGEGVHLYDAAGAEYLDAYNNVPCVGHAHPRVVAAITEQAGRLNTHTRYLDEAILDYSERLLAALGPGLEQVMYTCTGSEATDLALRIARFQTGHAGVVVSSNAYHGVTAAAAAVSPSLGPPSAPGPEVRTIAPPSPGSGADARSEGERMAAELEVAIDELERAGYGFAAFIADSIFSSDGIVPGPAGFLRPVADAVKAHGGVLIADEVQAGFARTGASMWGFQRHELEPDLVTMGKPMGNGMPIAAAAARPALLERFGDTRYFNTFGGNSVSIAAATAVLDVIEAEGLLAHVEETGRGLLESLVELAASREALRNPRGAGLFVAVDVFDPDGDSAALAQRVIDGLRDRHVLIATTGPEKNVLKIRPPLVFSAADADRLSAELSAVVDALS